MPVSGNKEAESNITMAQASAIDASEKLSLAYMLCYEGRPTESIHQINIAIKLLKDSMEKLEKAKKTL